MCKIYIYVSCSLLPLSYFLVTTSLTRALCAVAYIAPKAAASRIVCKLRLPRHGLDKVRAQLSHSPTHTHTLSHTHTHTHTLSLSLTHSLTHSLSFKRTFGLLSVNFFSFISYDQISQESCEPDVPFRLDKRVTGANVIDEPLLQVG